MLRSIISNALEEQKRLVDATTVDAIKMAFSNGVKKGSELGHHLDQTPIGFHQPTELQILGRSNSSCIDIGSCLRRQIPQYHMLILSHFGTFIPCWSYSTMCSSYPTVALLFPIGLTIPCAHLIPLWHFYSLLVLQYHMLILSHFGTFIPRWSYNAICSSYRTLALLFLVGLTIPCAHLIPLFKRLL